MRTFHKIAGAILALQLILWTLTGFLFGYKYRYDEAYEILRAPAPAPAAGAWASPADAAARAGIDAGSLRRVQLLGDTRGYVYLLEAGTERAPEVRLADARTGEPVAALDAPGAEAVMRGALAASPYGAHYGKVTGSRQVEAASAVLGRPATAWELALDTGQTVTVDVYTAEIAQTSPARDAIEWTYRIHNMQYTPWKPFNIALVLAFLTLVLTLVASGLRMLIAARPKAMFGRRTGRLRNQRLRF